MNSEQAFVNQFWGQTDGGFAVAQTRIKNSLTTLEELLFFYKERIAIEKEYNKKLEKLNGQTVLGSGETGTLKVALDKLQTESRNMVVQNGKFQRNVALQNYEKLHNFYQIYTKNTSKIGTHMAKVLARKKDIRQHLESAKDKYRADCSQTKSLTLLCQTTWGKELDRNTAKLSKIRNGLSQLKLQYQAALKAYKDIHEVWVRDWTIALLNLYQLEIERIQMCKLNCFSYCNNIALLCVDLDHCADVARGLFAKIAAPKDIHDYADVYGTGDKILQPPGFVDFMAGYDEDENEKFVVADFKDPDFSQILTRTFSVQSGMRASPTKTLSMNLNIGLNVSPNVSPQADSTHISGRNVNMNGSPKQKLPMTKTLPPIREPLVSERYGQPKFELPQDLAPNSRKSERVESAELDGLVNLNGTARESLGFGHQNFGENLGVNFPNSLPQSQNGKLMTIRKMPLRTSAYTLGEEHDVFDEKLKNSNGSSEYSNTTYSNTHSNRSWSSPRRKERSVHEVQEQINRRLRDMTDVFAEVAAKPRPKSEVHIAKDFSIDFMAKALEDLNAGGDGDVTQFRRSVRGASHESQPNPTLTQKRPPSDFVNDRDELATRRDTILFQKPRPKSMVDAALSYRDGRSQTETFPVNTSFGNSIGNSTQNLIENSSGTIVRNTNRRLLLRSPTKLYTNLNELIEKVTPVTRNKYETKAVAKYTYNSQESGELAFHKGWHMYVIHKQEDNWYVCELGENCGVHRGRVGLVPYNYVVEGDRVF